MNEEMNNNYNNTPNYNYEKNNSGVKVLLIILIILVLCLIGLTCYKIFVVDKKNDNKKDNNVVENNAKPTEKTETKEESNKQTNEETSKTNTSEYNSIANYIKENTWGKIGLVDNDDAFYIETESINKEKCDGSSFKLMNNGLNVEAKCSKTRADNLGYDYEYNITTKNNKTITVKTGCYSCGCTSLYSNDNYIIEYYTGCSINGQTMKIYNVNDGEEVYYSNNWDDTNIKRPYLATSSGKIDDYDNVKNHGVVFNKNKLYYVLANYYAPYPDGKNTKCRLMMVDLSSTKFKETEIDSMDCYYEIR